MGDIATPLLIVAGYIVLMKWVLPALGVPTCMSGPCGIPARREPSRGETAPSGESPRRGAEK